MRKLIEEYFGTPEGFLRLLKAMEHRERVILNLKNNATLEIYASFSTCMNYNNITFSFFEGFNSGKPNKKQTKCLNPKYFNNDSWFISVYNQYIANNL